MNRYRSTLLFPLVASFVVLGGCASHQSQSSLAGADQTFLENAAQGSHAEIQGSRLAQEKATSQEVKTFAQAMIEDHSAANRQLSTLAGQKGYSPPTEPSVMQRTEIKTLSMLSGTAFDKMYVDRIGVAAHTATIRQFEAAADSAQDPDVRAFAQKMLPTLQHHLEMARSLNERQKSE